MKRIMLLLMVFVCAGISPVLAQNQYERASGGGAEASDSYADTKTFVYDIEDRYAAEHPSAKKVKLTLEYTPLTGDVRFLYSCLAGSFDQGEAMNTALSVFQSIKKEMGFRRYSYKAKDQTKYYMDKETGQRMAQYSSFVNFTK